MSDYISREAAVAIADYATDVYPYDKASQEPKTYSEYNKGWNDACDYIRDGLEREKPTAVDAVPVVRCRDCKWWRVFKYRKDVGRCIHALEDLHNRGDDFFCARGERRDKDPNG